MQCIIVHEDTEGFDVFKNSGISKIQIPIKGQWLRTVAPYTDWSMDEIWK
jgi:hypothetical protein